MMGRAIPASAILVVAFLLMVRYSPPARPATRVVQNPVTQKDIQAVILAIQDEMYDEGCQGYGHDAADQSDDYGYSLPIYVEPSLDKDGTASVIYKFLPLGEVIREFTVDENGLAEIYGHPQWNFPPTEPSFLTVYLDDDELFEYKHHWIRARLGLELRPTAERVYEAAERQKLRRDGDYRWHKRDCSFSWR